MGLILAGRASYNRANPGKPGLKPPVKMAQAKRSKSAAARRRSFCARMQGMKVKGKLSISLVKTFHT